MGNIKIIKTLRSVLVRWLRAGKTEWAHALAGGLFLWGAEGSFAGLTANVPEAEVRQAHQPYIGNKNKK